MARLIFFAVLAALVITIIVYSGRILMFLATLSIFSSFLDHSVKPTSNLPSPVYTTSKAIVEKVAPPMPQWETIQPKSKAECLQLSGGALNPVFIRCHYGYQELVTYDSKGHRKVMQDRPIPVAGIPR